MASNESQGVSRRALIQAIGGAPALAATTAAEASAQSAAKPAYKRKIFDDRQWHTVTVLCDLILPADDRSVSAYLEMLSRRMRRRWPIRREGTE